MPLPCRTGRARCSSRKRCICSRRVRGSAGSCRCYGGTGGAARALRNLPRAVSPRLGLFRSRSSPPLRVFQGWRSLGRLAGLTGTAYGAVLLTKAALFAALIVLAARNRFRLTPALARPNGERERRALVRSIAVETAIGFCVVLAAGVLSSFEPGMHQHGG